MKKIGIIGFPVDLGSDRRGVDMGPSALRYSQLQSRLEDMDYLVKDFGDIDIPISETLKLRDTQLKYMPEIYSSAEILADNVEKLLDTNFLPLILGGDHAASIGSIAGIASHCRKNNKKLGVIWIDAHADMNTPETTPSGNIHGMPLAVNLGIGNKKLTHLKGFSPKILPHDTALIGIHDVDKSEASTVKKFRTEGARIYTMSDIDKTGIANIMNDILSDFHERLDHVHISFDIDSVDPDFAEGVGTPVRGGLSFRESHILMEMISDKGCIHSIEMVEVNPILDYKNKTAMLAVELLLSALGKNTLYD